jgi:large subunit ribosomal protein L1
METEKFAELVKKMRESSKKRNFEQAVELSVIIRGVDTKKPEGRISGEVFLPHVPGRPARVALFAEGELARVGREAGADSVISRDEIAKMGADRKLVKKFADDHDFTLAQADLMVLIGKSLGQVLGPRDKMPRPVPPTANIRGMIERLRKTVKFRAKDQQAVSVKIGVEGMDDQQLAENARAAFEAIKQKVEEKKGEVVKLIMKTTMGKPVKMVVEE